MDASFDVGDSQAKHRCVTGFMDTVSRRRNQICRRKKMLSHHIEIDPRNDYSPFCPQKTSENFTCRFPSVQSEL
jgi:hypothetical protein